MITLKEVEKEIAEIMATNISELKDRQVSRLKKRLQALQFVRSYLLESPSEDYLRSEVKRLQERLVKIQDGFSGWTPPNNIEWKECKKVYENENNVPQIKKQVGFMRYILKN